MDYKQNKSANIVSSCLHILHMIAELCFWFVLPGIQTVINGYLYSSIALCIYLII